MPTSDFIAGPWRAVLVLGVTQIITWGTLFYPPVLTLPLIAAERGWSIDLCHGRLLAGAADGGLRLPVGRPPDRPPWRPPASCRSARCWPRSASSPWCMPSIRSPILRSGCCSASRSRRRSTIRPSPRSAASSAPARASPITALTLAGGFASTVSWPVTYLLIADAPAGAAPISSMPRCWRWSPRRCTRLRCRASRADTVAASGGAGRAAGAGAAVARLGLHHGGGRVCGLCLRAVRAVGASAGDLRTRRPRCGDRGDDRHAVRAVAGRGADLRAAVCAQRPSARGRAACGRRSCSPPSR